VAIKLDWIGMMFNKNIFGISLLVLWSKFYDGKFKYKTVGLLFFLNYIFFGFTELKMMFIEGHYWLFFFLLCFFIFSSLAICLFLNLTILMFKYVKPFK
jgi:hypothetical protein